MSDSSNDGEGKPRYESPCAVPMGKLSCGEGICDAGLSDIPPGCDAGPAEGFQCWNGGYAISLCMTGATTSYCNIGSAGGA